jgi:hypothetical protein
MSDALELAGLRALVTGGSPGAHAILILDQAG